MVTGETEYSCGTVLYTVRGHEIHYVLIQTLHGGECGFPKGHLEKGESEEACALRETWEETSISAKLIDGFRQETRYPIGGKKMKTVTYFLASFTGQKPHRNDRFEAFIYHVVPYQKALALLTHEDSREILRKADAFLRKLG